MSVAKSLLAQLISLGVLCAAPAFAQDEHMQGHHHESTEQLGKVFFPVSCAPDSQKPFERGVALLHSFGYEEAAEQFAEIAQKDPHCAMAHWGIGMSLFHQIWERPQGAALRRGHEEMEKAQQLGAKTDRERGYISALALFYSDPATDYLKRARPILTPWAASTSNTPRIWRPVLSTRFLCWPLSPPRALRFPRKRRLWPS